MSKEAAPSLLPTIPSLTQGSEGINEGVAPTLYQFLLAIKDAASWDWALDASPVIFSFLPPFLGAIIVCSEIVSVK